MLKSPTSESDLSDPSGVCGHEVLGKFPTILKHHLKKAQPGPYTEMVKKKPRGKWKKPSK